MELVTIILAGILVASATYLILSKSVLRIIIGVSVLSHGVHLLILTMGQLKRGNIPVLEDSVSSYTDPLPQALILTAIVISFALTAYSLILLLQNYKELGTDNTEDMKGYHMATNILPMLSIILPFAAGVIMLFMGKRPIPHRIVSTIASAAMIVASLISLYLVYQHGP